LFGFLGISYAQPFSRSHLRNANDLAELICHDLLGITVDVYHLWRELDLQGQIDCCADEEYLFSYYFSDLNRI
jgi:sugar phosphate isomerase/epimerase